LPRKKRKKVPIREKEGRGGLLLKRPDMSVRVSKGQIPSPQKEKKRGKGNGVRHHGFYEGKKGLFSDSHKMLALKERRG